MSMYIVSTDSSSGLSNELVQRTVDAMITTLDRVTGDCLVDDMGRPDECKTMRRSEVFELILDADHMADQDVDAARYTNWLSRHHKTHFKAATMNAFPYKTYGY